MSSPQSRTSPDPPGGGLGYALAQAAHAWRSALAAELADVAVTPPQFFVLASLLHASSRRRAPLTQRALAERTGVDANTTSQVVRGLERRGLVARHPDARDSRALVCSLTAEGLALARLSTQRARALNGEFFAAVDGGALLHTLTGLSDDARRRQAAGTGDQGR